MKRIAPRPILAALFVALLLAPAAALAADAPDFSGTYSLVQAKSGMEALKLVVRQRELTIEVTRFDGPKRTTNTYSLDGNIGPWTSNTGVPGKCKGEFHGKTLVLENTTASQLQPSAPLTRIHTTDTWQLSRDGQTLTIKTAIDSPDVPEAVSHDALHSLTETVKYVRSAP